MCRRLPTYLWPDNANPRVRGPCRTSDVRGDVRACTHNSTCVGARASLLKYWFKKKKKTMRGSIQDNEWVKYLKQSWIFIRWYTQLGVYLKLVHQLWFVYMFQRGHVCRRLTLIDRWLLIADIWARRLAGRQARSSDEPASQHTSIVRASCSIHGRAETHARRQASQLCIRYSLYLALALLTRNRHSLHVPGSDQ